MPYASNWRRREHERKRKEEDPEYVAQRKEYMRQYYERNRASFRAYNKKKWQQEKGEPVSAEEQAKRKAKYRRHYLKNQAKRQAEALAAYYADREASNERAKIRLKAYRTAVLTYYGNTCVCCGSKQSPQVDHIVPWDENSESPATGSDLWLWLIRNKFPAGFQILCRPCNRSKGKQTQCQLHN